MTSGFSTENVSGDLGKNWLSGMFGGFTQDAVGSGASAEPSAERKGEEERLESLSSQWET